MCIPDKIFSAVETTVDTLSDVFGDFYKARNQQKEYMYRKQIALKNYQDAQNKALNEWQKGIEESRNKKIESINQMKKQAAINAASGFDLGSKTNMLQYQDEIDIGNINAKDVQDKYNSSADDYFKQAQNYLFQSQKYDNNNSYLFDSAMGLLGASKKVAKSWFSI